MKKRKAKQTHRTLKAAMKAVKAKGKTKAAKKPGSPRPRGRAVSVAPAAPAKPVQTRRLSEIKLGKRHRKDYGDLKALARSIEERGALLQPIVITDKNELIAGERRMRAWSMTRFALQPIPVHVVSIDAIIAGEWDENAQRKDFTLTESVAIRAEIEKKLKVLAKARMTSGKAAPTSEKGQAGDQAARFTGKSRRTLDKAKEIVDAAKQDPKKFGKLKDDMDRTGRADGPHRRLKIIKQTEAIKNGPPIAAFEGKRKVVVIDYPWPNEPGMTQAEIDAAARSLRPYPAMAIEEGCKFMAKQVAPMLEDDCVVYFWTTNYHLINGHAGKLLHALGFDERSTLLTWDKELLGRGQILREVTEHVIIAFRGKPLFNILGKDPPTTLIRERRRENSRKPDTFYRLVERATPAGRYASIFSRGGEGELWDCHGDEVGKYAPGVTPPAPPVPVRELTDDEKLLAALKAIDKGKPFDAAGLPKGALKGLTEKSHGKSANKGKLRMRLSYDGHEQMKEIEASIAQQAMLRIYGAIEAKSTVDDAEPELATLRKHSYVSGKGAKLKITKRGAAHRQRLVQESEDRLFLARMPEKPELLGPIYRDALVKRDQAMVADDEDAYKKFDREVGLIGDREGMGLDSRVELAAAAPIGQVPVLGQLGMWQTEHDGIPLILRLEGEVGELVAFAVDPHKPFCDECGDALIGCIDDFDPPMGTTMAQAVDKKLREAFARARKNVKSKKAGLPLPDQVYQLPAAWPKTPSLYDASPKRVSAKAARAALAKAKADADQDQDCGLDGDAHEPDSTAPGSPPSRGRPEEAGAGEAGPVGEATEQPKDPDQLELPGYLDRRDKSHSEAAE